MELNPIRWHINLLTHQKVCANPNTTCSPLTSMCPLRIETIWNIANDTLHCLYHLMLFSLFMLSLNLLHLGPFLLLVQSNCILPPLLLICMIYISICIYATFTTYLHPFYLYHMFVIVKPLFYNGKTKIDTKCHTKHLGMYDWININFKHTR